VVKRSGKHDQKYDAHTTTDGLGSRERETTKRRRRKKKKKKHNSSVVATLGGGISISSE
jgi:hypothetical protein